MSEFHSQGFPVSLLHSSVVPCEIDRILVQESIRSSKQSLVEVDQELERLKASIADLEHHRFHLQESLAHKQGILSPLRHLPPEILEEIFLQYHVGASVSWPRLLDGHSPWTLGRVCSFWRSVYLALPGLWSTFHFDLSGIADASPRLRTSVADLLQTCLQRSGTGLLRFTFHSHSGEVNLSIDDLSRSLLSTLVEASSRWYEVNLYLNDLSACSDALSLARGNVNQLRSLRLVSTITPTAARLNRQPIDAFADAPCLVKLSLQNVIYPTSYLQIPWNQLRYLTSKGCTFFEGEFSTILREARLLEEFVTEDERVLEISPLIPANNDNDRSSSLISLPNLRSLAVVSKSSYINRIFQLFTTPALTTLSIHARTSLPSTEHILAMLQRSAAFRHLRVLEIETSKEREASWQENWGVLNLLRAAEGLERCILKVYNSAETILPTLRLETRKMGMTGRPSASSNTSPGYGSTAVHSHWNGTASVSDLPFVPNLKYFELHDSRCSSTAELKAMLQSRMGDAVRNEGIVDRVEGDIARLETVVLNLSQPKPPDLEFQEIVELAARSGARLDLSLSM